MKNSIVLGFVRHSINKLHQYYEHSFLNRVLEKTVGLMNKWASGSYILDFFHRDWKEEQKWTGSMTYRLFTLPGRAIGSISAETSEKLAGLMRHSLILSSIDRVLGRLLQYSTRVYGLGLLAFAVTHSALRITKFGAVHMPAAPQLALMAASAALILLDRPLAALFEGSFLLRLTADFFMVGGKCNDRQSDR